MNLRYWCASFTEMVFIYRWKQSLLISIFSFLMGVMITCFFIKIDDGYKKTKSLPENVIETHFLQHNDIVNKDSDQPVNTLVILIITDPASVQKRKVLRETWLQFCKDNMDVRYYFVVGSAKLEENNRQSLFVEHEQFNDLLFLPNIVDNYSLLTKKVLSAFIWVDKNIKNYKYVLKCDDDTFVRVDALVDELKSNFNNEKGINLYWGFFSGKANVKKRGKWKEDNWILCDYYLPYALGGGYVLSQRLINIISQNSDNLQCFKSEDISVGAWLAPYSINREHDCKFDTEYQSRGCSNQYLVTHKQSEKDMKKLYDNLKNTGQLCTAEYKLRPSYIYNWSVLPSHCCLPVIDDPDIP